MKELLVGQRGEEHIWKQVAKGLGGKRVEKPAQACKEQHFSPSPSMEAAAFICTSLAGLLALCSQTFIENSKNWTRESSRRSSLCLKIVHISDRMWPCHLRTVCP